MFDVCVPTWNSLEYLKILHKGLKRNTRIKYNFLVHDNGSEDGTRKWLKEQAIRHTYSEVNTGFTGVNAAIKAGKSPYVIIVNSDMYPLPGWDVELFKQLNRFKANDVEKFTISCSLIEPMGNNPEYVISNHGCDYSNFKEDELLKDYLENKESKYTQQHTTQYSHPILLPRKMLEEMNYLDTKYFPGWAVDHDLAASAYSKGCRNFIMLTSSRVYHFVSKTFTKLPADIKNRHGEDVFEKKWKMSVKDFRQALAIAKPYQQVEDEIIR